MGASVFVSNMLLISLTLSKTWTAGHTQRQLAVQKTAAEAKNLIKPPQMGFQL